LADARLGDRLDRCSINLVRQVLGLEEYFEALSSLVASANTKESVQVGKQGVCLVHRIFDNIHSTFVAK
jgi:hypothetical protein